VCRHTQEPRESDRAHGRAYTCHCATTQLFRAPRGRFRYLLSSPSTARASPCTHLSRPLFDLNDRHGDWEVVRESILINRITHSAEWDRLRIETRIDHGRRLTKRDLPRVVASRGSESQGGGRRPCRAGSRPSRPVLLTNRLPRAHHMADPRSGPFGSAVVIGSACRCTSFQVPSSRRKVLVTRSPKRDSSSPPPTLACQCSFS
jgi:hypothetical protein